jgi:peptide/nickel transport system ATP-binding protein
MYRGEIVEIAPTDQIFSQPQHPYTQSLLAAVPSMAAPFVGTSKCHESQI